MSTWTPVPKITAAALGGATASLAVWALDLAGVQAPPAVAAALTALLAFAAGYLKAPAGVEPYPDDAGRAPIATVGLVLLILAVVVAVLTLLGLLTANLVWTAIVGILGLLLLIADGGGRGL